MKIDYNKLKARKILPSEETSEQGESSAPPMRQTDAEALSSFQALTASHAFGVERPITSEPTDSAIPPRATSSSGPGVAMPEIPTARRKEPRSPEPAKGDTDGMDTPASSFDDDDEDVESFIKSALRDPAPLSPSTGPTSTPFSVAEPFPEFDDPTPDFPGENVLPAKLPEHAPPSRRRNYLAPPQLLEANLTLPTNNKPPATEDYSLYGRDWSNRRSYFGDFYADPMKWPPALVRAVHKWYLDGQSIYDITRKAFRTGSTKVKRSKSTDPDKNLPPFLDESIGPPRAIDIYAMLATCVLIHLGHYKPGDPRYAQFALSTVRTPRFNYQEPNSPHNELSINDFLLVYDAYVRNKSSFVGLRKRLLSAETCHHIHPIAIDNIIMGTLNKAIRRRQLDIQSLKPEVALSPKLIARALFDKLKTTGVAFRHGDQLVVIHEWPKVSEAPFSILPGKMVYPLGYLLQALPSLTSHLSETNYDWLEHLKALLITYAQDGRPAHINTAQ